MKVEVFFMHPDGSPGDPARHEAPSIRVKTWRPRARGAGMLAMVKLYDEQGRKFEAHHYAHVSWIRHTHP